MPDNAADRNDSGAGRGGAPQRRPLAEVRKEARGRPSPLREQIMDTTLRASAELGYRNLSVAAVVQRYGGHRGQFYKQFANLGESYATAHAAHAERLQRRLLSAAATASSWRAGLHAALEELGSFANAQPLLANGLLIQVHVAGGPALTRRKEVLERLSRALDSARRETRSRHSPPPLAAPFMVSAIEAAVVRALVKEKPEELRKALPELEPLISSVYFGDRL
jgi:AcrR family transcriptional regulator